MMTNLFTTLSLIVLLTLGIRAQNCGPLGILDNIPVEVCNTDSAYSLHQAVNAFGLGVITEDSVNWYFDPSLISVVPGTTGGTSISIMYYDACQQLHEELKTIVVNGCQQNCGSITAPVQLPQTMCNTDDAILIGSMFEIHGGWQGDGIVADSATGSLYFDPSYATNQTTATVTYGAFDQCFNYVTHTQVITILDCNQNCGEIFFPLTLPSSVCHDDQRVILSTHVNWGEEWFGPGVSVDTMRIAWFDPSHVNPGTSVTIIYGAYDLCQNYVEITGQIFVEDCGNTCGDITFPIQLPEVVCNTDEDLLLPSGSGNAGYWSGDAVATTLGTPPLTYFLPSMATTNTLVGISYTAYDQCQNLVTVTDSIFVENCTSWCDSVFIPVTLPDTMCTTDTRIMLIGGFASGTYSGDGIVIEPTGATYFDPSLVDENTSAIIIYSGYNNCQQVQTIETRIEVIDCGSNCGTVTIDLPDVVCHNDNPISIVVHGAGQVWGDGVVSTHGTATDYAFDPSAIDDSTWLTVVYMTAQNNCNEWVTISKTIDIDYNCPISSINDEILDRFDLSSNYVSNYETITATDVFEFAEIINAQGVIVSRIESGNQLRIEVPTAGSYLARFQVEGLSIVKRLLVK